MSTMYGRIVYRMREEKKTTTTTKKQECGKEDAREKWSEIKKMREKNGVR